MSDNEFVAAAQQFLATHWQRSDALVAGRRGAIIRDRYVAAMATSGRLVGQWPMAHGGLGWTSRERWLWEREAAAVQAPQPPLIGPDLLAPLILQHGSSAQQAQHLPGIAKDYVHWCQALGEDSAGLDIAGITTVVTPLANERQSGWLLTGTKPWVLDLPVRASAQDNWACVLARVAGAAAAEGKGSKGDSEGACYGLFLVDLATPGVAIRHRPMVGESPDPTASGRYLVGSLGFTAVVLPASALLGSIDAAGSLGLAIEQAEFAHPAAVARNSVLLEQLRTFVESGELDGGSLWRDDDYRARLHALEVANAGLLALQARAVAGTPEFAAGAANLLLASGSRALSQELAQLQVEALGYFALPFASADVLDNEGPIGPEFSQPVLFGMLSNRAREAVMAPRDHLKNIIAKSVLGLSSATDPA